MFKTILVPTSGSASDKGVFETALAVAKPFNAHLRFVHVRVTGGEAVARVPHAEFCRGAAISQVLEDVQEHGDTLANQALRHVHEFCSSHTIELRDEPRGPAAVTASWCEERDQAGARLLLHARHCALTVLGRREHSDFMPTGLLEELLLKSGRPILIVPQSNPPSTFETIAVGWKETPESARVLSASLPLLERARSVYLLAVAENGAASAKVLEDLADELAWHGIHAQPKLIEGPSPKTELQRAAARIGANLLVVGAFGHGPLRESVFGGVTQSLMTQADIPVFMLH